MGEQTSYSLSEAVSENTSGINLSFFEHSSFEELLKSPIPKKDKAIIFSYLARFNTLYMIARAGSGHIGSSFSSMEIVSWLYLNILSEKDKYFSSNIFMFQRRHDTAAEVLRLRAGELRGGVA